ncbi:MAG: aminoglycoside phosphotransferase family protein [Nanoarchaeota archaeon]|nr:aminoglycoside phosphotransferase family protein [Nanoarchaeota archaeon]
MDDFKLTNQLLSKISKKLKQKISSTERFKSGRANSIFLIKTNKKEYVLKIYTPKKSERYKNDLAVFRLFSKEKMIPNVITKGEHQNIKYLIMTKIPGNNLWESDLSEIPKKDLSKIFFDLGRFVAKLHSTKHHKFGKVYNPKYKSWDNYLKIKTMSMVKKIESKEFQKLKPKITRYLEKNHQTPDLKEGSFIHDDIQPENIIIKSNKLVGIVDFDRAFWGDPLFEFPYIETTFHHIFKKVKFNYVKHFYKGYFSKRKFNKKDYEKLKDHYALCSRYIRTMSGFKSLRKVIPKKAAEEIIKKSTKEVDRITKE